jgi:hypothetical protein
MKNVRLSAALSAALMLTCLSLNLWPREVAAARQAPFLTGTYIITNTDSGGAFVSRGLIAFNADHTLSVVDSKQGVTPSFSNQLGTWGFSSTGILTGRTIASISDARRQSGTPGLDLHVRTRGLDLGYGHALLLSAHSESE